MDINVSVPHKMLLSGAYTVLDGSPSLTLAISPRLHLSISTNLKEKWSDTHPFIQAVKEILLDECKTISQKQALFQLFDTRFTTHTAEDPHLWGIGSSAAFTTAFTLALSEGIALSLTPSKLFEIARNAHRLAQGNKGSGTDIAACTFGGLVHVSNAHTSQAPNVLSLKWLEDIGIILIQSGQKADTRQLISLYQDIAKSTRELHNKPLIQAVENVCHAITRQKNILEALHQNHLAEIKWTQTLKIPLITTQHLKLEKQLQKNFSKQELILKSLGGGGGDSFGLFYNKKHTPTEKIIQQLTQLQLPFREITIEQNGALKKD